MQEPFLGEYVVAFIDVLGQRDRLKGLSRLPVTEEETIRTVDQIQDLVGSILGFRGIQSAFIAGVNDTTVVPENADGRFHRIFGEKPEMTNYGLSDAVISAVHLSVEEESHLPVLGVYYMLLMSSEMMIASLEAGFPLRGGIEMAPAIVLREEVFGPVLAEAYEIEAKVAKHPRIVIGPKLCTFLNKVSELGE